MLPLVSSMTTTEIGWISFWKNTIGCGLSLSKTSNSSCVRPATSRLCASATVTKSDTTWVPDLNVGPGGCCASTAIDIAAASATHADEPAICLQLAIASA